MGSGALEHSQQPFTVCLHSCWQYPVTATWPARVRQDQHLIKVGGLQFLVHFPFHCCRCCAPCSPGQMSSNSIYVTESTKVEKKNLLRPICTSSCSALRAQYEVSAPVPDWASVSLHHLLDSARWGLLSDCGFCGPMTLNHARIPLGIQTKIVT